MLQRSLVAASFAAAIAGAGARAHAAGGWAAGPVFEPIEQRVAVAAGPQRSTLWTSLRFRSPGGGPIAIIVPVPPGAALDIASDAWFEALEVATAPRIFPPPGGSPFCPGKSGPPNVFEIDGEMGHVASLAPTDVAVLDDVSKLTTWASQVGVSIPPALQDALSKMNGVRFLGVGFNAPGGAALTPTLRVAMGSGMSAALPLALTRAGVEDLRVTAWTIGPGRGNLIGGNEVTLSPASIVWDAKTSESDYVTRRNDALGSDPTRFLLESASHDLLGKNMPIAAGTAAIDSVVSTFFERAAAYGDGNFDAATCVALVEPTLESGQQVADACPQASIGVVPPAASCVESTPPGKTNPGLLRCGLGADDLAVALSGVVPKDAFVSRHALVIPAGGAGQDWIVGFPEKAALSPVLQAGSIDFDACGKDGGTPDGGMSSSSSSSSSSGKVSSGGPIIHDYGGDPGGGVYIDVGLDDVYQVSYDEGCSCSGGGSEGSSYDVFDYDSPDTCDGDASAAADSCSSDTSGDTDCSGGDNIDTESCSSGDGGDSCDGGGGGEACSGGGGDACSGFDFDCTTARTRRARGPKFSIMLVCALAVLAPLRRRGTKAREAEREAKRARGPRALG